MYFPADKACADFACCNEFTLWRTRSPCVLFWFASFRSKLKRSESLQAERLHVQIVAKLFDRVSMRMPYLYFCKSRIQGPGMLHAVLSWEESQCLLGLYSARFIGDQFSNASADLAGDIDFAVLRIFDEEVDEERRAGFYHIGADIMQIDEALKGMAKEPRTATL